MAIAVVGQTRLPVGHAVDFLYPGWVDAQAAGMTIVKHLTGAEKQELACLAHCGWVVQGFTQSMALPHKPVFGAAKSLSVPKTAKQRAKLLEQAFGEQAFSAEKAVPWGLIFMVVKALLEAWLKRK